MRGNFAGQEHTHVEHCDLGVVCHVDCDVVDLWCGKR